MVQFKRWQEEAGRALDKFVLKFPGMMDAAAVDECKDWINGTYEIPPEDIPEFAFPTGNSTAGPPPDDPMLKGYTYPMQPAPGELAKAHADCGLSLLGPAVHLGDVTEQFLDDTEKAMKGAHIFPKQGQIIAILPGNGLHESMTLI